MTITELRAAWRAGAFRTLIPEAEAKINGWLMDHGYEPTWGDFPLRSSNKVGVL